MYNVGQRLVIIHHFPFLFLGLIRRQAGLDCQSLFGKFYNNILWILQPTISFPHFVIIVQKFPNFWEAYIILLSSLSLRFCLRNCRSLSNDQALCFLHLHIISDQFATSTGQVHPYRHQQYIYKLLPYTYIYYILYIYMYVCMYKVCVPLYFKAYKNYILSYNISLKWIINASKKIVQSTNYIPSL